MITDLVAPQEVSAAVALNRVAFNLARAVGPAFAGIILACTRRSWGGFSAECSFLYRSVYRSLSLEVGAKREHTSG
jgi:predicted MFS family arabinose efflux permease